MSARYALSAVGLVLVSAGTVAAQTQIAVNGATPPATITVTAGSAVSTAISSGPGNATDWIGLYASDAPDGAYTDWRYLNGATVPPATGLTDATVYFMMPVVVGNYEFRFYASNGYERVATSVTVAVVESPAHLTVNGIDPPTAASAGAGTMATVAITGGPANATDWVALYAVGAPDSANLAWQYLNGSIAAPAAGAATATLLFQTPIAAGSYEFRFFVANTYARVATSTTLVVDASMAQLAVNNVVPPAGLTIAAGSAAVVSASSGPANAGDWVGLYQTGAQTGSYLDWRYLNNTTIEPSPGVSAATLIFMMPVTPGTYEFRFLANNTYAQLATSSTITVPTLSEQITVNGVLPPSTVSVQPGATLSVQISGGPGNPTDWVTLASSGAPDTSYVTWAYLNGSTTPPTEGVTTATLTFTAPSALGSYQIRLYVNNSYGRLATSTTVTVANSQSIPIVTINLTDPFAGTTLAHPASINVAAATSVANGSIVRVDFYAGATLLGMSSSSPYSSTWTSPLAGSYLLTAIATDNLGLATSSLPVSITVTSSGTDTLGMPIATPSPGVFAANHPVSLTAAEGTTIRYTTNMSVPTQSSPIYTGPLTLTASTTVAAQAFEDGWTASDLLVARFQIDTTPPVITPVFTPIRTPAGWNNGPVTVSFECSDDLAGIASCPGPVVFSNDGAGQTITVTATDLVGNQASQTVVVNIDSATPTIALTGPVDGTTTQDSSVSFTMQVTANTLSGVVAARCAGTAATIMGGVVQCIVSLMPGANSVVVSATNAAGTTTSKGITVVRDGTPTILAIKPTAQTLTIGGTKVATATTEYGVLHAPNWTSSNTAVFTVVADGTITGMAGGQATLTATSGALSAQATITVLAGAYAMGSVQWSVAPDASGTAPTLMVANRVDDSGPDMFATSIDWTNDVSTITSLRSDGTQVNVETIAGLPQFGDVSGGLVAMLPPDGYPLVYAGAALAKIGGTVDAPPWRYEPTDSMNLIPLRSNAAQAPDGTTYLVEVHYSQDGNGPSGGIVALDGQTGQVKLRVPVQQSSYRYSPAASCSGVLAPSGVQSLEDAFGSIFIGGDGAAYVEFAETHDAWAPVCHFWPFSTCLSDESPFHVICGGGGFQVPGDGTWSRSRELKLLRVDPSGGSSIQSLWSWDSTGPDTSENRVGASDPNGYAGTIVPDGTGGVLAQWELDDAATGTYEEHITRSSGTSSVDHSVGIAFISLVDENGTAYLDYYGADGFAPAQLEAIDVATWATKWTREMNGAPVVALDGGHIVFDNWDSSSLVELDETGATVATTPLETGLNATVVILHGQGSLNGIDAVTGSIVETVTPQFSEAAFTFVAATPYAEAQAYKCNQPILTAYKGLAPSVAPYTYRFLDNPNIANGKGSWTPTQKLSVTNAFDAWNNANAHAGLITHFAPVSDGATGNIDLRKELNLTDQRNNFIPAKFAPNMPGPNGRIDGGAILFTVREVLLSRDDGYFKAAMHEVGHVLGLDHTKGINGSSVMNDFRGPDDYLGNLPTEVRVCDAQAALKASTP